ncbi:MAG: Aldose 1-epimerase [Actinotalea sp.]|nr:Aldose 1-epimerase [Actinotalea sp.]
MAVPDTPAPRADLPGSVRLSTGEGGLPVVRVTSATASAEVYLHGAHVTAWAPAGEQPVLWLSSESRFSADAAIRGGVPICFPWFGAHPRAQDAPAHGFARLSSWALVEAYEDGEDVVLTLGLADSAATRGSAWPHAFEARCTVTVGRRLTVALDILNRGEEEVTYEAALHTYLAVGDIRRTLVSGLEGTPYVDRLQGEQLQDGEADPVRADGETDRIYLGTTTPVRVTDESTGRVVTVSKQGSDATVVWNPWSEKAAAMGDMGDDEWTGMLCVETCNVRSAAVSLAPGQRHTMATVLEVG